MTEEVPPIPKRRYQAIFKRDGKEVACTYVYGFDETDTRAFINSAAGFRHLEGTTIELVVDNRPNQAIADIVCECGHQGFLHRDAPDFAIMDWHWYASGFKGNHVFTKDGALGEVSFSKEGLKNKRGPPGVLEDLKVECPNCGRQSAIRYA